MNLTFLDKVCVLPGVFYGKLFANRDNFLTRFPALKPFFANPVVVRDLRAQLRGVRAYGLIAGYLLLLGLVAIAGYAQATGQSLTALVGADYRELPLKNIVDAQANLEAFFTFIDMTLALLITVIAPALTASSIVSERERQSFDLLVTTPLTATHLLMGKLLSSVAFIGLLLVLSLPATMLCILLGSATLPDVLRMYFLLAVDGIVLSAIGLYFSSTVRSPLLATLWTYATVVGFFGLTYILSIIHSPVALSPFLICQWLNPLTVIHPVTVEEKTAWQMPLLLLGFLSLAGLLLRQFLLAATYRLGLFGTWSAIALRKQALLLTAISTGLLSWEIIISYPVLVPGQIGHAATGTMFVIAFALALPFLAGLFVPASAGSVPGAAQARTSDDPLHERLFDVRQMFQPVHSGALPWYCAYVATVFVTVLTGILSHPALIASALPSALAGSFYLLGVGSVTWALSRLAAKLAPDLSSARATAFGLFLAVFGLPVLLFTLQFVAWEKNPLAPLWLFSPILYLNEPSQMLDMLIRCGCIAGCAGFVVFLIERNLRVSGSLRLRR